MVTYKEDESDDEEEDDEDEEEDEYRPGPRPACYLRGPRSKQV